MLEFCIMNASKTHVVNMGTTHGTLEDVQSRLLPGFVAVPVSQVPHRVLVRYRYWSERP